VVSEAQQAQVSIVPLNLLLKVCFYAYLKKRNSRSGQQKRSYQLNYCSGITEALRAEVAPLGIKVTIVEPGYFRTQLLQPGNTQIPHEIADYAESAGKARKFLESYNGKQPGDPKKACERIVDIVTQTGTAQGREIPVRIALGTDAYGIIKGALETSLKSLEEWKDVTVTTDHDDVKTNATH
jgi:hypothetical protein